MYEIILSKIYKMLKNLMANIGKPETDYQEKLKKVNGSGKRILTGVVDLTQSGVGSGTNIEYKIETLNNKSLKFHGIALHWD